MLAYSKIIFLSNTELSFLACYEYGFVEVAVAFCSYASYASYADIPTVIRLRQSNQELILVQRNMSVIIMYN